MGKITLGLGVAVFVGLAIGIAIGMAIGIYLIANVIEDVIETDGLSIQIQLNETHMMDYAMELAKKEVENGNQLTPKIP